MWAALVKACAFARDPRWIGALDQRGLHLCPCPSTFTRICPSTGKVSMLDRVATNSNVCIKHVETVSFSDHLALIIRAGPVPTDSPRFPRQVLANRELVDRLKEQAESFGFMITNAETPSRKCELWDVFKNVILEDAVCFAKKERKKARKAHQQQQQIIFRSSCTDEQRLEAKRTCDVF